MADTPLDLDEIRATWPNDSTCNDSHSVIHALADEVERLRAHTATDETRTATGVIAEALVINHAPGKAVRGRRTCRCGWSTPHIGGESFPGHVVESIVAALAAAGLLAPAGDTTTEKGVEWWDGDGLVHAAHYWERGRLRSEGFTDEGLVPPSGQTTTPPYGLSSASETCASTTPNRLTHPLS